MGRRSLVAGFTMIELVLVLLIMAVVAGFSLPIVVDVLNAYRLRSAVSSATWAIQSTRFQALEEGYPFQVTFSGATNPSYQIASEPAPAVTFSNVGTSVPLSGSPVTLSATTVLQFKANGAVTATTGGLSFQIAYSGHSNTVTVSNYGNVTVTSP